MAEVAFHAAAGHDTDEIAKITGMKLRRVQDLLKQAKALLLDDELRRKVAIALSVVRAQPSGDISDLILLAESGDLILPFLASAKEMEALKKFNALPLEQRYQVYAENSQKAGDTPLAFTEWKTRYNQV